MEVFDFNKIEQAKTLGLGSINLADLEPFEAQEAKISLISKEGAKGWVRVVRFSPPTPLTAAGCPGDGKLTPSLSRLCSG